MDCYGGYQSDNKQWGVSTTSFPISVSAVYSIIAAKKDTSANSVPDVQNYSSTGFAYYGPSPYAWFAVCKAQQWGVVKSNGVLQTFSLAFATRCFAVAVTANIGSSYAVASSAWDVNKTSAIFYADTTNAPLAGWYYAIGVQQWGVVSISRDETKTFTLPITCNIFACSIQSRTKEGKVYIAPGPTASQATIRAYSPECVCDVMIIGVQQWGVVNSYGVTVTFPLTYSKLYCLNAYMTASSTSTIDLYSRNVTLKTFDIVGAVPDDAFGSFDMAFWLSLGI